MCRAIDLEPCEVWEEIERTARKEHTCSACNASIMPGDRYLSHFSVFEGYTTTNKACQQCVADRKEFCDAHGGQLFTPDALRHMLSECIADGDEESETRWRPMLNRIRGVA